MMMMMIDVIVTWEFAENLLPMDDDDDDPESREDDESALRAALKLTCGRICHAAAARERASLRSHLGGEPPALEMSPEALATLSELTLQYVRNKLAPDLAAFAAHARRTTVSADDVCLVARANPDVACRLATTRDRVAAARPPPKPKPPKGAGKGAKSPPRTPALRDANGGFPSRANAAAPTSDDDADFEGGGGGRGGAPGGAESDWENLPEDSNQAAPWGFQND
jgi:histone H3/H4